MRIDRKRWNLGSRHFLKFLVPPSKTQGPRLQIHHSNHEECIARFQESPLEVCTNSRWRTKSKILTEKKSAKENTASMGEKRSVCHANIPMHCVNPKSSWSRRISPVQRDPGLFVRIIQVLVQDLGHGKHVHPILLEDGTHGIVAADLTSITWILELIFPDIFPYFFDRLGP